MRTSFGRAVPFPTPALRHIRQEIAADEKQHVASSAVCWCAQKIPDASDSLDGPSEIDRETGTAEDANLVPTSLYVTANGPSGRGTTAIIGLVISTVRKPSWRVSNCATTRAARS